MPYLQFEQSDILEKGGLHTAIEIQGQPALWQEVYDMVFLQKESINNFLFPILSILGLRIILTGAGSSAFIGEAVQGIVQINTKRLTHAIATTDLITHPQLYFMKDVPTLMISFARSGNSPESIAAVDLANNHCSKIYHMVITCNKEGALMQSHIEGAYYLVLPEKANDKSLAMTGSFTGMLLSIILIAKLKQIDTLKPALVALITNTNILLQQKFLQVKAIADKPFKRVIFLGSGPLLGIARECHLKLQELTDGNVICKHDSFLGFRHGPRAVINKESLIVYLFSSDPYVSLYERDLCLSIDDDDRQIPTISWNQQQQNLTNSVLNIRCHTVDNGPDDLAFIGAVVLGQLLGFYHSLYLGLKPDNPSVSGSISRVVQGVTIYTETIFA